jgi:exodeoxyribonuclease V alpha subunit
MNSLASAQEVLAGLVERVTFHNVENGFCVLRTKARGHRDLVTVVGQAASISAGERITASGEWVNDRTHGQQFRARFLKTSAPTSIEGIEKYLGSGMIRGIGPAYAKKLVGAFGEKVFDTIEAEPDRLREIDGIGPVRAKRIVDAWAEQKIVREIMMFLHTNGVGTARAVRIYKTYGSDAVQVMTDNPYRLTRDVRGIGFKTADAIAMRLGVEKTAMIRLRAGISFALAEAMDEGHCGLPTEELNPLAVGLLDAPANLIRTALDLERSEGAVIADKVGETDCIFLAGHYRAEQVTAERLIRNCGRRVALAAIDAVKAVVWVEERNGLALADTQRAAIRLALTKKALVVTGGPGVGKTTIVRSILRILAVKGRMLFCAPTGRVAKRMTEATGFEARTIHRLLEVDPKVGGFKRNEGNCLDCDLLVIDEASMVDALLMQALLRAVPGRAALLIVGDIDQLPSVGRGQVLDGHHRVRRRAGCAPYRCLSTGGGEPDRRQRPPDQPGPDAGSRSLRPATATFILYRPTIRRRRSRGYWRWSSPVSTNGSGSIPSARSRFSAR